MSPRRVRFSPTDAPEAAELIPSIGPVVFSVQLVDGGSEEVDLSDLGLPRLVRPLARGMASEAAKEKGHRRRDAVRMHVKLLREFVAFTGAALADMGETLGPDDLEPELLDAFATLLTARHPEGSGRPKALMRHLTRFLKAAEELGHARFETDFRRRLEQAWERDPRRPLNSYPFPVFDALEAAARADVGLVRDRILEGERVAATGRDPEVHGWDRYEDVLWYIANRGPLRSEHLTWKIKAMGGMGKLNAQLFLTTADVVRFQILLGCQTGLEPECVGELKTDCLVNPARGFVSVKYLKRRAHGDWNKTIRVRDGGNLRTPGGVLRLAMRLGQRARDSLGTDEMWVVSNLATGNHDRIFGLHKNMPSTRYRRIFLSEHGLDSLLDHDGEPLRSVDLRRLRKTFKSKQYLRSGGVLPDFASGHTPQVAGRHYADIEAHAEIHDSAIEAGLGQALAAALPAPVVLDDDGRRLDDGAEELPSHVVADALSGATDVWLSSCKNFFDSPWAAKKGTACPVPPWVCLECPNAVFTTRHLPSVLSVLDTIERQREEFATAEWHVRFGLAHERITTGVLNRFTSRQIATARAIAECDGARLALPNAFLETIR